MYLLDQKNALGQNKAISYKPLVRTEIASAHARTAENILKASTGVHGGTDDYIRITERQNKAGTAPILGW